MIKLDRILLARARLAAYDSGLSVDRCSVIQSALGDEPDFTIFGLALDEPRQCWSLYRASPDFSDSLPVTGWDFDSSR